MPVRFEGASEYQRKFAWIPSKKSASYQASGEQLATPAGIASVQQGATSDPPMQHKKRVDPYEEAAIPHDEYILLGDQQKFAPSVKYQWKKLHAPHRKKVDKAIGTANGHVKVTNAVKYKKDKGTEAPNGVSQDFRNGYTTPISPPPAPRPQVQITVPKHSVDRSAHAQKLVPQPSRDVPVVKKKRSSNEARDKRSGRMHEFAQTDMDAGVGYSAPEAPAEYAMKYRAGIAPPRPKGPKRLSEYQMQYKWKEASNNSPLLAAEQVVYQSAPVIGPHKRDAIPKYSEYKAQFQPWHQGAWRASLPGGQLPPGDATGQPQARPRLARSKSAEALDKMPAAGLPRQRSEEDKRLVKESLNPQRLHFPHGKHRRFRSEYALNFKPPQEFEYLDGAWRGANPPHVESKEEAEAVSRSASSWFAEVMELRSRASEYKRRAQGMHFSREHLGQLYARNADLWDEASTISALSLEVARPDQKHPQAVTSPPSSVSVLSKASSSRELASAQPPAPRLVWDEDSASTAGRPVQGHAQPQRTVSVASQVDLGTPPSEDSEEGRLPTPDLAASRLAQAQRHHLDLTTPAVGGAILVAPTPGNTPPKGKKRRAGGHMTSSLDVATHQPIAGQEVRCTCGADDDLADDLDLSPSLPSPAHRFQGQESQVNAPGPELSANVPVLRAEQLLGESGQSASASRNPEQQHAWLSQRENNLQPEATNNNALVEEAYSPDIQPKYKDIGTDAQGLSARAVARSAHASNTSARASGSNTHAPSTCKTQPATTSGRKKQTEPKTPFVAGFQTMGRNYNMPEYLIKWQAEQFDRAARRKQNAEEVPVYLQKQRDRVPMTTVRSRSVQAEIDGADQEPGQEGQQPERVTSPGYDDDDTEEVPQPGEWKSRPRTTMNPAHVYGVPTRDTHVLLDEGASVDRPLHTSYTHSPLRDRAALKEQLGIPSTIHESQGVTWNRPPPDDDVLSVVSQASLASSCSLASEVLERARHRKDQFWGKRP